MRIFCVLLVASVLVLGAWPCWPAHADTISVPGAFDEIKDAMDDPNTGTGDVIQVEPKNGGNNDPYFAFTMKSGVTVEVFSGSPVIESRDASGFATTYGR